MTGAEAAKRVDPLRAFTARAEARALLAYAGALDAQPAIDTLLDDAFESGLLDEVGLPVLNAILEAEFAKYDEAAA